MDNEPFHLAVLRIPNPQHSIISSMKPTLQWCGPLQKIQQDNETKRIILAIRMAREHDQISNIAFDRLCRMVTLHDNHAFVRHVYRPAISMSHLQSIRTIEQLSRDRQWRDIDVQSLEYSPHYDAQSL